MVYAICFHQLAQLQLANSKNFRTWAWPKSCRAAAFRSDAGVMEDFHFALSKALGRYSVHSAQIQSSPIAFLLISQLPFGKQIRESQQICWAAQNQITSCPCRQRKKHNDSEAVKNTCLYSSVWSAQIFSSSFAPNRLSAPDLLPRTIAGPYC